jgi:alkylation response protein AidB-like acyl-CoA dehydrogenase
MTFEHWSQRIHDLGRDFETRSELHDAEASFVSENYTRLQQERFLAALVPESLGGGGLNHSQVCELLRLLGQYCGSTALAVSMHQHLVAAAVWRHRQGQGGPELLRTVASRQPILVSTGARDWLESSGEMVRTDGGYRVKATKSFASQSAVGDILVTSAPHHEPGSASGAQVLHFAVSMKSEGICVLRDWHTLGMRGTGSHTVRLENVFVPDAAITLRRPRGVFHPVFNVVVTVAMPLIMAVYVGIAQRAAREAVDYARRQRRPKLHWPEAVGGMLNELASAEIHHRDMIRLAHDLDFRPEDRLGQEILTRKTNVANACIGVVTRAMEIVGGQAFYRSFGLERLFRDVQGARYHPLPEAEQQRFLGEWILGSTPRVDEPAGSHAKTPESGLRELATR